MKFFFLLFLSIAFSSVAIAQNKVKATQQGNGNTATINQSGGKSTDKVKADTDCNDSSSAHPKGTNQIVVNRGNRQGYTVLYSVDKKLNIISDFLYTRALYAYQYGSGNGLLLTLPDTGKTLANLDARQSGSDNLIFVRGDNSPNGISLSQEGSGNSIAINPCEQENSNTENGENTVNVKQSGDGNSAGISQN